MSQPQVSIITPVYNADKFLVLTYESVASQTFKNWEWILIDDCSSDKSWESMLELQKKDSRVKVFQNESNQGSGKTRNKAIEIAEGRFIAFLDSDDIWHKDKLAIQIDFMLSNNIAFSHTSYGYLDEAGNKIKETFRVRSKVGYKDLLKRTEISCLTAVYDSKLIGKYYMSEHRRKQDYALWLSILKDGHDSYGIDRELAFYRQVKNSATSKKYTLVFKHITFLEQTQGFSKLKAMYYTFFWLKNGIFRYFLK